MRDKCRTLGKLGDYIQVAEVVAVEVVVSGEVSRVLVPCSLAALKEYCSLRSGR